MKDYEKDKIINGYYNDPNNRKSASTDELRNAYIYQKTGNFDHIGNYDPKHDDLMKYHNWTTEQRNNMSQSERENSIQSKVNEEYSKQPQIAYGGGRNSFTPNQRQAMTYDEASGRAKEQLDPLYERALENVRNQRYQNELNSSEVASKRGLAHSGLAADQLNKIGIATQSNISDLDAQRAAKIAEMAQRMVEFDQNMTLQERAQALSEYLGVEGLNLNREQFDWGKHTNQRDFDYGKSIDSRNFDYQQQRDSIGDKRYEEEFTYQKSRDLIADERYKKEFDEDVRRFGLEFSLDKQVKLGNLSISQAELALAQAREARLASNQSGGSGGGSGGGGSNPSSNLSNAYQQFQQEKSAGNKSAIDLYYESQQMNSPNKDLQKYFQPVSPALNPNLTPWEIMKMFGN